jgi:hypothetical protein
VGLPPAGPASILLRGNLNVRRKGRSELIAQGAARSFGRKVFRAQPLGTAIVEGWINSWLLVGVKSPGEARKRDASRRCFLGSPGHC